MPTYEYKCPSGHITEKVAKVADYQREVPCDSCDASAARFISRAPMGFISSNIHYTCPITGNPITSRKEHDENLARHGCRILETGEREEVIRQKARDEAAFDSAVEKTAEEFVEKLDSKKREQLGREIESGLDVSVERH